MLTGLEVFRNLNAVNRAAKESLEKGSKNPKIIALPTTASLEDHISAADRQRGEQLKNLANNPSTLLDKKAIP